MGNISQSVGGIGIKSGDVRFNIENDNFPLIGDGAGSRDNQTDKWRTSAFELGIGEFGPPEYENEPYDSDQYNYSDYGSTDEVVVWADRDCEDVFNSYDPDNTNYEVVPGVGTYNSPTDNNINQEQAQSNNNASQDAMNEVDFLTGDAGIKPIPPNNEELKAADNYNTNESGKYTNELRKIIIDYFGIEGNSKITITSVIPPGYGIRNGQVINYNGRPSKGTSEGEYQTHFTIRIFYDNYKDGAIVEHEFTHGWHHFTIQGEFDANLSEIAAWTVSLNYYLNIKNTDYVKKMIGYCNDQIKLYKNKYKEAHNSMSDKDFKKVHMYQKNWLNVILPGILKIK